MADRDEFRRHTLLAMAVACCMIAHQVAGKAARDGFFLTRFPATDLPKAVMVAALISVAIALWSPHLFRRWGPGTIIPLAFAGSGLAHLGEWFVRLRAPELIAVVVYLHIVALGAILLSGFWLLLSELFDPHEAKHQFGRVAAAGTFGGVVGGIAAERLVTWFGSGSLLLLLGSLHLGCAVLVQRLPALSGADRPEQAPREVSIREAFRRTPLLWSLAALVFLGTCGAALLDYLFKSGATHEIGRGRALVRYFAIYYTGCQVLTLLMQLLLTRHVLERWGIGRTAAALPIAAGTGSVAALFFPVFPLMTSVRAVEAVLRGSFFRSAYELFYTPVAGSDKRSAKTMIDVACDRLGDAAGAGMVQLIVSLAVANAQPWILRLTVLLSAVGATIAWSTGRAYRGVLELGLLRRAQIDPMMSTAMGDYLGATLIDSLPAVAAAVPAGAPAAIAAPSQPPRPEQADAVTRAIAELRSAVPSRVMAALGSNQPFDPILGAQAMRLLAWDEVSSAARGYLERGGSFMSGQLTDALLNAEVEFGIRRRIPRLLARAGGQRSVDGLLLGLNDSRFEVRFQCGRGLDYLRQRHPELHFPAETIYSSVERELSVSKTVWRSWRVLDHRDTSDPYSFLDEILRERADQRLEHVFSLLAVVLPREPLMAAFRGLHQEDRSFRGLALEYLETLLPQSIRDRLWVILEESPETRRTADPAEAEALLESLLRTNASSVLKLKPPSAAVN
jgi:hypothetical protein